MKIARETSRDLDNQAALDDPQVGDYWHEMFCPYFIVVAVKGEAITVLSCLGGPDSYNRKEELNARVDNSDHTWSFDYSKHMVVDKDWIRKTVRYGSIDGFVADVVRNSEKNKRVVEEWVGHQYESLLQQMHDLGPTVSQYLIRHSTQTS